MLIILDFLKKDLQDFDAQIIPDEEVRNYTIQFISKCLRLGKIVMKNLIFGLNMVVMVNLSWLS